MDMTCNAGILGYGCGQTPKFTSYQKNVWGLCPGWLRLVQLKLLKKLTADTDAI